MRLAGLGLDGHEETGGSACDARVSPALRFISGRDLSCTGIWKRSRAEVWTAVAESVPGGAFAAGAEGPVASGESIYSVRVVED